MRTRLLGVVACLFDSGFVAMLHELAAEDRGHRHPKAVEIEHRDHQRSDLGEDGSPPNQQDSSAEMYTVSITNIPLG